MQVFYENIRRDTRYVFNVDNFRIYIYIKYKNDPLELLYEFEYCLTIQEFLQSRINDNIAQQKFRTQFPNIIKLLNYL